MTSKKKFVRARVTLQVEIDLPQGWDGGCQFDEVFDAAARDARLSLENLSVALRSPEGVIYNGCKHNMPLRIVGIPKVTTVVVEEER